MLHIHCQRTVSACCSGRTRPRRRCGWVAGLAGALLLAGCTSPNSQTASIFGGMLGSDKPEKEARVAHAAPPAAARPQPARGSCEGAAQCSAMLKTMIDNPDRGWIGQRQPPDSYANGTRLFAYRALRRQLTCGELNLAVTELAAASRALDGSVSGMSPDQVSRTRALSSQVETELARERDGRCRT